MNSPDSSDARRCGLYLHVPFCREKCHYCDFASQRYDETLLAAWENAVMSEITWIGDQLTDPLTITTLYWGGGTPSLLPLTTFARLHAALERSFVLDSCREWTVEANPDSITRRWLDDIMVLGVNRISLGVQSLGDSLLTVLQRIHDADQARHCLGMLRESPITRWSADLMCGIPGQSLEQWKQDLVDILQFEPPHLSIYPLTLEGGTPLARRCQRGLVTPLDDDLVADMLIYAEEFLETAGYEHYEIASYCLPGEHSLHNRGYWLRHPYVGVGPAAASLFNEIRSTNVKSPEQYISLWNNPDPDIASDDPFKRSTAEEIERLTTDDACREDIMLGTRLLSPFDLEAWKTRWGSKRCQPLYEVIEKHLTLQTIVRDGNNISLTKQGRWIANTFWQDLL